MNKITMAALLAAALGAAGAANATTTVVDFENIHDWDLIDGYGGLSGWESMIGQVASYNEFQPHGPELGENWLHTRAGELTFDNGPVIFQGMFYNYWGGAPTSAFHCTIKGKTSIAPHSMPPINRSIFIGSRRVTPDSSTKFSSMANLATALWLTI